MEKKGWLQGLFDYLNKHYLNQWIILVMEVLLMTVCSVVVCAGFVEITRDTLTWWGLGELCAVSAGVSLFGSLLLRSYRDPVRYAREATWLRMSGVILLKSLCVGWVLGGELTPRVVWVLVAVDFMFTVVCVAGVRLGMLVFYNFLCRLFRKENARVLVYGEGSKSVALEVRLRESTHYQVVGFLVPGNGKKRGMLSDLPVYTSKDEDDMVRVVNEKGVSGVLFAKDKDARGEERRLLEYCKRNKVRCLIAPTINEADGNGVFHQFVRPIRIEDLLGRDEIVVDTGKIQAEFQNKVVLVTGAAGSIGSELCRQLAGMGVRKLILFDSAETLLHNIRLELEGRFPGLDFVPVIGDVRVRQRVRWVFETYRPSIVFHAAAYKHVPLMEENPCEAILVNVTGSKQVADTALEFEAEKMVMISTDKAVNPTNVMGASKRLAEIYVQSMGCAIQEGRLPGRTKFITTRFGNVLGSNGSVIPRFKEQIENGGPVTVTHPDIIRFFMTIPEACRLVLEAATIGEGNEILVFDMGQAVKIADLARRMIELAGFVPGTDIKIEYTGLRPGEKLYEEVLSDKENTLPTENPKIKVARVRHYDYIAIKDEYDHFERLAREVKIVESVALMKKMVPEFKSRNSRFEELDRKGR